MAKSACARRLITTGVFVPLVLALPMAASAHATLVKCNLAPGARLSAAPKAISCTFAEGVNPKGSFIGVFQATGDKGEVDGENSAVSFTNAKEMTVSVPKLAKGTYNLVWFTISANDGHRAGGYIPFTIK